MVTWKANNHVTTIALDGGLCKEVTCRDSTAERPAYRRQLRKRKATSEPQVEIVGRLPLSGVPSLDSSVVLSTATQVAAAAPPDIRAQVKAVRHAKRRATLAVVASREQAADEMRVANWMAAIASTPAATSAQQKLAALRDRVRAKQELLGTQT